MFPRRVRFLHDGKEFYLVDGGRENGARILTLLRRCAEPVPEGVDAIATDLGPCERIAAWRDGEIELSPDVEPMRAAFRDLVARYLAEYRTGRPRPGAEPFFFLTIDGLSVFELTTALPYGLSVLLFSTQEAAERAARLRSGTGGREIVVERTGDLADFLEARVCEGFAGAWIDGRDPIFPCRDASGHARFLRMTADENGEIEHFLLEDGGRFRTYEGQEDLDTELDIDFDRHDEFMRERLGDTPFVGHFEGIRFHRPAARGAPESPVIVACDDDPEGEVCAPIFHDLELGEAFLAAKGLGDHEWIPIDDLFGFVREVEARGRFVRIQPETHRARGGRIFSTKDALVLDTYSGLWSSSDGFEFTRLHEER